MLGDVERVAVVGAKTEVRRVPFGQDRCQGVQVLADRPLADQHPHPLAQFLERLVGGCRLVFRPDARADVAVQVIAPQQRRVAVDMATGKGLEFRKTARILEQHAGEIHELGQPDDARMIHQRNQIGGLQPGTRRFHMRRGDAGRQLHADVHHRARTRFEEIVYAFQPADIRNLVRIADRRRHTARADAAVELIGRDKRAFDVEVRVDEPRHKDLAGAVDDPPSVVAAEHADDGVPANRDIRLDQLSRHEVEHAAALQHEVGGHDAPALVDPVGQFGAGHHVISFWGSRTAAARCRPERVRPCTRRPRD